ncbi:MAG: hypothetical protein F6K48_03255 [Okeania sp. SIO3H1]|nr:hypothetical protein [Okeania sp. SIO3H1]
MEVFCYNAAQPREQLESFNHRLADFCQRHMVVNIAAQMVGPTLTVSLTLDSDLDLPMANTLTVAVTEIDGRSANMEEVLSRIIQDISATSTEETPLVPFEMETVFRPDLPVQGFAIFSIINGTAVLEEE